MIREYYYGNAPSDLKADAHRFLFEQYLERPIWSEGSEFGEQLEHCLACAVHGAGCGQFKDAFAKLQLSRIGDHRFLGETWSREGSGTTLLSVLRTFFEPDWAAFRFAVRSGEQALAAHERALLAFASGGAWQRQMGYLSPLAKRCYLLADKQFPSDIERRSSLGWRAFVTKFNFEWREALFAADYQKAEALAAEVRAGLADIDPDLAESSCILSAGALFFQGKFDKALTFASRGEQVLRDTSVGEHELFASESAFPLATALCYKAILEWHCHNDRRCDFTIEEAVRLAHGSGRQHAFVSIKFFSALIHYLNGRKLATREDALEIFEVSSNLRFPVWKTAASILLAWADADYDGIRIAIGRWISPNPYNFNLSLWYSLVADVAYQQGLYGEGERAIREALRVAKDNGEAWRLTGILTTRARIARAQSRLETYQRAKISAVEVARRLASPTLQRQVADEFND